MTSEAATSEAAAGTSGEITEADVEQYMTSLSNWGRGLALVQRFMGLHEAGDHLDGESVRFDAVTEYVGISAHGSSTHVDGLAHYSWDGQTYNGFPESDTTFGRGARSFSVHHAEHGFVTRGVLLDIAARHGVRWLDRGHAVRPAELEAAEAAQGVRVRPGDALLVHTGNVEAILTEGPDAVGPAARQAGLHASCLPFLRERDVAVLGNDGIQDVQPSGYSLNLLCPVRAVRSSPWACGSSTTCS
jgi:kynurenine formamidase